MDLDEFMIRNKVNINELCKTLDVCRQTIALRKNKKVSPRLLDAIKIFILSDGQVTFEEMLIEEDKKKIDEWLYRLRLEKYKELK